jgi:hypothetical protein
VFDPRSFDADVEAVPHFAFELRAQLAALRNPKLISYGIPHFSAEMGYASEERPQRKKGNSQQNGRSLQR